MSDFCEYSRVGSRRTQGLEPQPGGVLIFQNLAILFLFCTPNEGDVRTHAFITRYGITLRKQSNSKSQSAETRKPNIQKWHARLRRRVKRGVQVSPKWGCWLPEHRFNVDQVPLTLTNGSKETYDDVGSGRVWVAGSKKGDDKREATLQLCVRLSNSARQPKATIIFRGKGLRLRQSERESWDSRVNVLFQPKAWADNSICLSSANDIFAKAVTQEPLPSSSVTTWSTRPLMTSESPS